LPNANRQVAGAGIGGAPPLEVGVQLRTRPDVVDEGGQAKKVLQNAARKEGAYFVAPKMIDHDDS
jgi:Asp-tRNA(Asn)/Glu-tRNA(Gln) amidotransferase C subunit